MLAQLLVLLVILIFILDRLKSNKLKILDEQTKVDYPRLPIVGHGYLFIGNSEDLMHRIQEMSQQSYRNKHGVITFWLGNKLYSAITDPIAAKPVLKLCMEKGYVMSFTHHLIGNGTIFAPVHIWRPRRKVVARAAAPRHVDSFFEVFVRNSSAAVGELASVAGKGDFSIWDYFSSYTLNLSCRTLFGEDLNLQKDHPFFHAFVEYFENIAARFLKFWLHLDTIYELLPVYKKQTISKKIIHDFSKNLINKRKRLLQALNTSDNNVIKDTEYKNTKPSSQTFLDLLIQYSGNDREYTDKELLEESLVFLLASTDTSATAGCYTLLLLAHHHDVQDKLYEQIHEIFGDSDREIKFEDISKCTYLDAVLKESLRLYPPVPIIVRKCDKDLELPTGLVIPQNSEIVTSIWGMHHNPNYWGADADQFRPERFLSASPEQLSAFMPFSYGNRNCIGYRYSMLSLKVMLVSILRRYRINPATSFTYDKEFRVKFEIMMKHVDNFEVQIERRL